MASHSMNHLLSAAWGLGRGPWSPGMGFWAVDSVWRSLSLEGPSVAGRGGLRGPWVEGEKSGDRVGRQYGGWRACTQEEERKRKSAFMGPWQWAVGRRWDGARGSGGCGMGWEGRGPEEGRWLCRSPCPHSLPRCSTRLSLLCSPAPTSREAADRQASRPWTVRISPVRKGTLCDSLDPSQQRASRPGPLSGAEPSVPSLPQQLLAFTG